MGQVVLIQSEGNESTTQLICTETSMGPWRGTFVGPSARELEGAAVHVLQVFSCGDNAAIPEKHREAS